jgi:hypothetical protein
LNGNYLEFLKALKVIETQHLQFDAWFGHQNDSSLIRDIRKLTLENYVKPYKVIDLKEISKAFGIDVQ